MVVFRTVIFMAITDKKSNSFVKIHTLNTRSHFCLSAKQLHFGYHGGDGFQKPSYAITKILVYIYITNKHCFFVSRRSAINELSLGTRMLRMGKPKRKL